LTTGRRFGFVAVARFLAAGLARFAARRGLRRVAADRDGFARFALRRRAVVGFLRTTFRFTALRFARRVVRATFRFGRAVTRRRAGAFFRPFFFVEARFVVFLFIAASSRASIRNSGSLSNAPPSGGIQLDCHGLLGDRRV
jgi:hypothetical protein